MRKPEVTTDESDSFRYPETELFIARGSVNGQDLYFLFDVGCLQIVLPYEICNRLKIKVQKGTEYINVMASKTKQEIGEIV